MSDDEFEPRLGRQGNTGKAPRKYAARVAAGTRVHGVRAKRLGTRFDGSRIGRAAVIGRLLSTRNSQGLSRSRRAVVKTSLVHLKGRGLHAARAHLNYIQRGGVTRGGEAGELYGRGGEPVDGREFLARCAGDRHQFRVIISLEDGERYEDLRPYVRRLMDQVEKDLGTGLDWAAVDHHDTGHPHTHVVVRGVDDKGRDLVIAREYLAHGLRERAAELATRELGLASDQDIEARFSRDADQERLTAIDRRLLARLDSERCVMPEAADPIWRAYEIRRLHRLEAMELARSAGPQRWRLDVAIESTLTQMGERADVIRVMQRELIRSGLEREIRIHTPAAGPLIGKVQMYGVRDQHRQHQFLLVDGVDGHMHYLDLGVMGSGSEIAEQAVIRALPAQESATISIDHTIGTVAAANSGEYSQRLHLRHDPHASAAQTLIHEQRLEVFRRAGLIRHRDAAGTWTIPGDFLERVGVLEERRLRDYPVEIEVLAKRPLAQLATFDGVTWLDHELSDPHVSGARDQGFGRELRSALAVRRQWLVEQDLAHEDAHGLRLRRGALAQLQRRELLRLAEEVSRDLGKTYVEAASEVRIEGRIARRIEAEAGGYAVIENARDFTLVPLSRDFARQVCKAGAGIVRDDTMPRWTLQRGRQGPEIG